MWGTSPHHSWITTTPGPDPEAGVARYPPPVVPLLGNSMCSPMSADATVRQAPGAGPARVPALPRCRRSPGAGEGGWLRARDPSHRRRRCHRPTGTDHEADAVEGLRIAWDTVALRQAEEPLPQS